MGLDISAYRKLKVAANQTFDADGCPLAGDDCTVVRHCSDFPGRCDEFPHKTVVRGEERLGYPDAPSMSYGYYNRWRDELAKLAGYAKGSYHQYNRDWDSYAATVWHNPKPGPFMELIHFSDCEGWIGTAVSAKLACDFAEFQAKADAHQDERWRDIYARFRKAFEIASDGGAVYFH